MYNVAWVQETGQNWPAGVRTVEIGVSKLTSLDDYLVVLKGFLSNTERSLCHILAKTASASLEPNLKCKVWRYSMYSEC